MANIRDIAKAAVQRITTDVDNGFAIAMTFTTPDGLTTANVNGLSAVHHTAFDTDGVQISEKKAYVSVSEAALAGYPVRNSSGEVDIKNHRVTVKDSTGETRQYVIKDRYPDSTVGLLVFILSNYAG